MRDNTSLRSCVPGLILAGTLAFLFSLPTDSWAQTYTGVNAPGGAQNFSFTVAAGVTNLVLEVENTPDTYSHLLLKKGSAPTDASYDFIAQLDGQNNSICLQAPEFSTGTWWLRVRTPAGSLEHAFTVTRSQNLTGFRSADLPALKPVVSTNTGRLGPDEWHYFRVEMPAGSAGWRLVLSTAGLDDADLYVSRGVLPTESAADRASVGMPLDTLIYSDAEAVAGAYFIAVHAPATVAGNVTYTLFAELGYLQTLAWDPGTNQTGSVVFTNRSPSGGDYYFKIIPQNSAVGAWRTALSVQSGEAEVYLTPGPFRLEAGSYPYGSAQTGADGFVVPASQFNASEEWFILVHATPGAQWRLVTGEAFVHNLGPLASSGASSTNVTVGPEGMAFFKTTVPLETLAWRLWLNGADLRLLVRKEAVPVWSRGTEYTELAQRRQMLVVPEYLDTENFQGLYFVGVAAAPGTLLQLDSRQQPVSNIAFASTNGPVTLTGYGYATYRVQVPVEQIAWQVAVVPVSGNPNVGVRRLQVPNEFNNDALSEVPGGVTDSLTLVPPTLSDGTFYVTVYGESPFTFRLQSGNPVITPIPYVGWVTNDDTQRAGWRLYAVSDIAGQLGSLGWYLWLSNQPPGTEVAIRRNAVPGRWNYRSLSEWQDTEPEYSVGTMGHMDQSGVGLLQQPGHPADIWYVGVYSPATALGPFRLTGERLTASPLAYVNGRATNALLQNPRLDYYAVTIPSNAPSWKVRLGVTDGEARLLVLKDQLPLNEASGNYSILSPPGKLMEKTGPEQFTLFPPYGQSFLLPGTYYLGVTSDGAQCGYVLESLGALPVTSLGLVGGTDLRLTNQLEGGAVKAYRFEVPAGVASLEVRLEDRVGNPVFSLLPGTNFPSAVDSWTVLGDYGSDGGQGFQWEDEWIVTLANPAAGLYTLLVKASFANVDGLLEYPDAQYTLRLHTLGSTAVTFNGGSLAVSGQQEETWRYFRIQVPANALGWDVRLTNVLGGWPHLRVRRDLLPDASDAPPVSGLFTAWASGSQWDLSYDWTGHGLWPDGTPRSGQTLAACLGNPLEPGLYYVGVQNSSQTDPASYQLVSRGIGSGQLIPVTDLGFSASVTNHGLPAGEAAYYRVVVPSNSPSWRLTLIPTLGDASLAVQKDVPPNVEATGGYSVTYLMGGRLIQKPGPEHFALLPASGETNLEAGTYYVTVISEGVNADYSLLGTESSAYRLTSGPLPVVNLGTAGLTDLTRTDASEGGEVKAFQFTVPSSVSSLEVRLEGRTGNPWMQLAAGPLLPTGDQWIWYGTDGGQSAPWWGPELLIIANPTPGVFSLLVAAHQDSDGFPDAGYTIRVHAVGATPLAFDGGSSAVTDHLPGTWHYFQVSVPSNAAGWDLRLRGVTAGNPILQVCRDRLPNETGTPFLNGTFESWPSGLNWDLGGDWTGYGSNPDGSSRWSCTLAAGMGNPLEPGDYYVGVRNSSLDSASYTLVSRGIGAVFSIPIGTLAFTNGVVTHPGLVAGEAAYFQVSIPSNAPSWRVKLSTTDGEALLLVQKQIIPNIEASLDFGASYINGGQKMQKAGPEHFLLLPPGGQSQLMAGVYCLAVVSEGVNPSQTVIGTGSSAWRLESLGSAPVSNLGTLGAAGLSNTNSLEGGQIRLYQFTIPSGLPAFEVRLEDRIGNPVFALCRGSQPPLASSIYVVGDYGSDGGVADGTWQARASLLTLPNPEPGIYSLLVKAAQTSLNEYPDATYTLRLRRSEVPRLNFAASQNTNGLSNFTAGQLADGQSTFYQVMVPATLQGQPVIGWRLDLAQTLGQPMVRVRKDLLPSDETSPYVTSPFAQNMTILVPPYLSPGTWFVEVRGQGNTDFTLNSQSLALDRPAWVMPLPGQPSSTPGLSAPDFGDTGVDPLGHPVLDPHTGTVTDQGVDLAQGDFHYYAVFVPTNNGGLLRTELEALSGIPNFYLRADFPPTLSYGEAGLFDRAMNGSQTQYGNWVPMEGRTQTSLTPGLWYVAIHAAGTSNVRYRLRLSVGRVQDLPWTGAGFADQRLAAGDWGYYRVAVPTNAPASWLVTFGQQLGDVMVYLRDTVPPGCGYSLYDTRDWATDLKNQGAYPRFDEPGTYALPMPPVRPGCVYYIGVQAKTDATFSISSGASGAPPNLAGVISFYNGYASNLLAAHASLLYRVDVPPEGTRWLSRAAHPAEVTLYLEPGTLPALPVATVVSSGANSLVNQPLDPLTWPWQPGQSWFLLVTNTGSAATPFTFAMDGRNASTENGGPGITFLAPTALAGGQLTFDLVGGTNRAIAIQASTDLRSWTTLWSYDSFPGWAHFEDPTDPRPPYRFYRVITP